MTVLLTGPVRFWARLPWPAQRLLGRLLAWQAKRRAGKRRKIAAVNLKACFPDLNADQHEGLLGATIAATTMGLVEAAIAYWRPWRGIRHRVQINGLEHVQAALGAGRGVLMITGHATAMELGGRALCEALREATGSRAHQVARRHNHPGFDAAVTAARSKYCASVIEKKDLRSMLKALRAGEIVMHAPDQNFTYHSVFAPFFGVAAATVTATADIAGRTDALVVPWWIRRLADGSYLVEVEPYWEAFPSEPTADAQRINQWLEAKIRQAPEQYLWVHRKFRHRPPDESPFYSNELLRAKHHERT